MSGSLLRPCASTTIPLSSSSPAVTARSVLGVAPIPTRTTSAGMLVPSPSTTAPTLWLSAADSMAATVTPVRRSTPCSRCRSAKDCAELRADHGQQRLLRHLEDGDVGAGLAGRRGGLQPDPATADDDDVRVLLEGLPEPLAVLDGAQVEHAAEVGAGQVAAPRGGAGGEDELVVCGPAPVGRDDLVGVGVDRGHRRPEAQVDVVVGIPGLRQDVSVLGALLALEERLGERRTVVRDVPLGGEEDDRPRIPLVAQRLGGLGAPRGPRRR